MGGATDPKDIAKQHEDALRLIREGMPYASNVSVKEIPLSDKQHPTFLESTGNPQDQSSDAPTEPESPVCCIALRGRVDISKLENLIQEGYNDPPTNRATKIPAKDDQENRVSKTNYWDEANAAEHNVTIIRPSHDAWGIRKIVLVFADDFLQNVYHLPWWWQKDSVFAPALKTVFDVLNIPPQRVVRLLFASLPPGVTIPIHHDTGAWVAKTHRVHVPVLCKDPDSVLFQCGPTPSKMERIDCTPGNIFEINNQGKHAVSNCSKDHRVHIILDYVDEDFQLPTPILLQPGERIAQSRRSIDRLCEKGKRPTPSFYILGVQKAGTTSLYNYIVQHPLLVPAKRRETHNLDWRWNEDMKTPQQQREWCLKFYEDLTKYPSLLTGDSTPSYLLDSPRVIPRIQQVFEHWSTISFFVMLRDPVRRAESHFAMVTSPKGTPAQLKTRGTEWRSKTLRQVVEEEMKLLNDCGVIPYWNIAEGTVDLEVWETFCGSAQEKAAWNEYLKKHVPLNTGSHNLLARGLYALNIQPWLESFDPKQILVLQMERDFDKDRLQSTLQRVWQHLDVPAYQVTDDSAKNTREYEPMEKDLQGYLQRFFHPHNQRLAKLLKDDAWLHAWRYGGV